MGVPYIYQQTSALVGRRSEGEEVIIGQERQYLQLANICLLYLLVVVVYMFLLIMA